MTSGIRREPIEDPGERERSSRVRPNRRTLNASAETLESRQLLASVITEFALPSADSTPSKITAGPDGNLWFTELNGNRIGRITPDGVITEFALPNIDSRPYGITAGPDGNIWFTEDSRIGRITPNGVITEFPLPSARNLLNGISAGPDGNLWFTRAFGNRIGRITPAGVITEFVLPAADAATSDITAGPDGNLWFTAYSTLSIGPSRIGRITPDGVITEFALPLNILSPTAITTGPDGNLWFTQILDNSIGRITPGGVITEFVLPSENSFPAGIATGTDGNLYFTEITGNRIGQITPDGMITEFAIPSAGSGPSSITAGPDGNLWFTEADGDRIGRLSFDTTGPRVTDLRRFGYHDAPTFLVLDFDEALNAALPVDLDNFRLVDPGRDGRFGTADDRRIAIRSADYDAEARTITLAPARRLSAFRRYQISIDPANLRDRVGNTLIGPDRAVFDRSIIVGKYLDGMTPDRRRRNAARVDDRSGGTKTPIVTRRHPSPDLAHRLRFSHRPPLTLA